MEVEKIMYEIVEVEKGWRIINFDVVPRPFSFFSSSYRDRVWVHAMEELQRIETWCRKENLERVKWVRSELAPLNAFLEKANEQILDLGERQRLWIRELKNIFDVLLLSLVDTVPEPPKNNMIVMLLLICSDVHNKNSLWSDIFSMIQSMILDLYRRYYTYGVGEIRASYGVTTISPRTSSSSSSEHDIYQVKCLVKEINHLSNKPLKVRLRIDLEMMKALIKDGRLIKNKDKRLKVWLNQMEDIFVDLEAALLSGTEFSDEYWDQIEDEICGMAGRKMMYGICGSGVGADCRLYYDSATSASAISEAHDDHSSRTSTRLLKTFTRESELMEALFKDVKTHVYPLDERLIFWLQELQLVAHETKAILGLLSDTDTERSIHGQRRCEKLNKRICTMSIWKRTYGVGDIKSSASSSISIDHQLGDGETVPYPFMNDEIDLIRRELKLMHALDRDITSNMNEVDRKTKAWVKKMRNVAKKAEDMLLSDNTVGTDDVDRIKDNIKDLSRRRVASGIQLKSNNTQVT
ncbi:hypothetical protein ACJIZ3_000572 [Penstemon smallii]|uniref:Uncharacterized protein n=1 Tax=Penstemon smallii TaxID=265156 RepID=A0ABD3R0Z0_9LAMI